MHTDAPQHKSPPPNSPAAEALEPGPSGDLISVEGQPQLLILSFCLSFIVCLIGFGGVLGWFDPGEVLAWWGANIHPLKFETAICLIFAGLSLLAIHRRYFGLSTICTAVFFIVSAIRLLEYLLQFDSGLSRVIVLLSRLPGPGDARMSPNGALSLSIIGLGLFCLVSSRLRRPLDLQLASCAGFLVSLLGCVSLLGSLSFVATSSGWSYLSRMSVQGGFANVLLGTSVILYSWAQRSVHTPRTSQLLRSMIVYSVLGVFFVAVFSAAFGMLPLYERLQRIDRERLLEMTENKALTLEQVLARVRSVSLQIANRTRARHLLEDLLAGRITAAVYASESAPIFQDIERVEPEIVSICRAAGTSPDCLVQYGPVIPDVIWPERALERSDIAVRGPIVRNGTANLIVSTPIWGTDSARLGTDVMTFSASVLLPLLSEPARKGHIPRVYLGQRADGQQHLFSYLPEQGTISNNQLEPGSGLDDVLAKALKNESGVTMLDFGPSSSLVAYTPVRNSTWAVVAVIDSEQLDFAANTILRRVSLGVLGLIGIGCLIIYSLIRAVAIHALNLQRALRQRTDSLERELTLRQAAERSLGDQKKFLHQIIDLNPNLIFAKNRAGEFTLVNTAVAEAYGISVEGLLGKTDADFNSNPEEVAHFREDDLKVIDGKRELIVPEEILTDAKGRRRWLQTIKRPLLDDFGEATQLLGVATDITIRKEAEEAKSRLAAIVESSADAIVGTTLDKIITSWNNGAEVLYGYSQEEAVGREIDFLVPADRMSEISDILTRLVRGEKIEHYETARLRRDGQLVHVSLSVSLVIDSRGRVVGVSSISRDISRRKEIEHELARYREELEEVVAERTRELVASQDKLRQSERMASIGALASGIAHEINNPVGAILLAAQNGLELAEQSSDPQRTVSLLQETCKRIIHNAKRCGGIVKGVLQFSREQRRERTPTDLNLAVKNSVELIHESMDSSAAKIRLELAPELPLAVADPLEMEQVIVNLVKNAIESASGSAEILIQTEVVGNAVRIRVSDNGCGIPKEQLKHIFDPFFTTRQRQGGTGLGLSVVHGIISAHGGTIAVDSRVGEGTIITIDIPFETLDGGKSKYARHTHC